MLSSSYSSVRSPMWHFITGGQCRRWFCVFLCIKECVSAVFLGGWWLSGATSSRRPWQTSLNTAESWTDIKKWPVGGIPYVLWRVSVFKRLYENSSVLVKNRECNLTRGRNKTVFILSSRHWAICCLKYLLDLLIFTLHVSPSFSVLWLTL